MNKDIDDTIKNLSRVMMLSVNGSAPEIIKIGEVIMGAAVSIYVDQPDDFSYFCKQLLLKCPELSNKLLEVVKKEYPHYVDDLEKLFSLL